MGTGAGVAPGVFSSIAAFTLETDDVFPSAISFANSLEIYAPVPERGSGCSWRQGTSSY